MKFKLFCLTIGLFVIQTACKTKSNLINNEAKRIENIIKFEISPYGLIFTDIKINDKTVKSMIDFGDPNVLQLSSTFVEENDIAVEQTQGVAMDIRGNQFKINSGFIKEVLIGNQPEKEIKFSSSPNEMESVSEQIGTEFHGVVGWGYFKQFYTTIDYSQQKFILSRELPEIKDIKAKINLVDNQSYLIIPVEINGEDVNALIDTGSPVSLLDKNVQTETSMVTIKIGEYSITEEIYTEDLSALNDLKAKVLLGGTFLSKFRIHINTRKNEIIVE